MNDIPGIHVLALLHLAVWWHWPPAAITTRDGTAQGNPGRIAV